jgi:hypothetical protein
MRACDTITPVKPPSPAGMATCLLSTKTQRHRHCRPLRERRGDDDGTAVFRGKFLDGLADAYERDELNVEGACAVLANPETFNQLKDMLYRKNWVVYAKRPFAGPEQVFKYLGRYTHRVGISNHRLARERVWPTYAFCRRCGRHMRIRHCS